MRAADSPACPPQRLFRLPERRAQQQRLKLKSLRIRLRVGHPIDPTTGEHKVGVLAQGTNLTLYVDDYRVNAVGVSDMPSGDVGPYAETTGPETISVLFTHLIVYQTK